MLAQARPSRVHIYRPTIPKRDHVAQTRMKVRSKEKSFSVAQIFEGEKVTCLTIEEGYE